MKIPKTIKHIPCGSTLAVDNLLAQEVYQLAWALVSKSLCRSVHNKLTRMVTNADLHPPTQFTHENWNMLRDVL
jgi:hypothetical protein